MKHDDPQLPDIDCTPAERKAWLDKEMETWPVVTKKMLRGIGVANRKLDRDPQFQVELFRGNFISQVLLEKHKRKMGTKRLAKLAKVHYHELKDLLYGDGACGETPIALEVMIRVVMALGLRMQPQIYRPKCYN